MRALTGNVDRSARLMNQKCESGDILYSVKAGVTFGGSELGRVRSIQLLFQSLSALQWLCGSHCVGTESATPIQAVNADASAAPTGGLGCNPGQENNVTRLPTHVRRAYA